MTGCSFSQDIALWEQFNGKYDFTFVGNTLNTAENNGTTDCTILTSAVANLNLGTGDTIEKAYLYWAGSGTGDFNIKLNNVDIAASRTFPIFLNSLDYFSAFADVTDLVQNTGNGDYIVSDLDLNPFISPTAYCNNRTNFGGWAMVVVYKNDALPLNQLNVYDGLQGIPDNISITLNSLNVIDDNDAKIGFIAWEGDQSLDIDETLTINGNILSNVLNPPTNAFNGTNTITNSSDLYNMDLDVYDIEGNIAVGDTSALIEMTSGRDVVLISTIVTKLNSQLPDATIAINTIEKSCNSRNINVDYTVYNVNSTDVLPVVTIAIYADGVFVGQTQTVAPIAIGDSENGFITLTIPAEIPNEFELQFFVDRNQDGVGFIAEIDEYNNIDAEIISLNVSPPFNLVPPLVACNEGLSKGTFDFSIYETSIKNDPADTVTFYETPENASDEVNPITNSNNFNTLAPKEIFARIESPEGCFSVTSFMLNVKNCPPKVYNLVAPMADNFYDTFLIDGLRDIFLNFRLTIYNRWGAEVWTGNNNTADWDGKATKGFRMAGSDLPEGTYFYVLELNDPDFPEPMNGFLYLKR